MKPPEPGVSIHDPDNLPGYGLGLVTQRRGVPVADACRKWAADCLRNGAILIVPAIADFEVRRELERAKKTHGLTRLNVFNAAEPGRYLPLSDTALRLAATLWAQARQRGMATADPKELDCDTLIAAQALTYSVPASDIVIATSNVGHLSQFVSVALWTDITP